MDTTRQTPNNDETVLISRWRVGTPDRQRATIDAIADAWAEAVWPDGLLTYDVHLGTDGATLLHHSRWLSDAAFDRFVRSGRDHRVAQVDEAVQGIERYDLRRYRLDRARVLDPAGAPGALVIVTFDVDGPEWQTRLVDLVLDYQDRIGIDGAIAPGMISNRFHADLDGTRVINYAEFTDEDAHQRLVDRALGVDDELPRLIGELEGVRARGFERFLPGLRLRPQAASPVPGAAVTTWLRENAHPLASLDGEADLTDLEPLRRLVGDAAVVGLGTSTRTAHEPFSLSHRIVRFLVEELGFRAVALEDDWTLGVLLDQALRNGDDDLAELLTTAWAPWQVQELVDLLEWARRFNRAHPDDPVRLVGVDAMSVRALAYDAVLEYVARTAADRRPHIETLYAGLRPDGDLDRHVERVQGHADKATYIDRARRAHHLVRELSGGEGHHVAVQHARAIMSFHEFHADGGLAVGEQRMAETVLHWHEHTGDRVVYLGGITHVAVADPLVTPLTPSRTMVGSYLRDALGPRYVAVAVTFHHGEVAEGVVAPPDEGFVDAALGAAGPADYLLDLRGDRPAEVEAWLNTPATIRVLSGPSFDPAHAADHYMTGNSLAGWFDAVAHVREVTPIHPLP